MPRTFFVKPTIYEAQWNPQPSGVSEQIKFSCFYQESKHSSSVVQPVGEVLLFPSGKNILNVRKNFKFVGYLWRLCLLQHIRMTVSDKSVRMGNRAVLSNFELVNCQIICLDGIRYVLKPSGRIVCLGQSLS